MNKDQWRRLEQLYDAAVELPLARRPAFLAAECADDEELRREVESLLAAHEEAGDFLAEPVIADLAKQQLAATAHALAAQAGRSVGPYRLIKPLGKGGMGEVFLAEDTRLQRKVALKLLPAEFSGDRDRVRRFEQEARAVITLNHPHIVTLYDFGHAGDDYFMATEFIDGRTLRAHLQEHGKLTIEAALDIAAQIAQALAAAHEAGIVHRDIKPENVMLRRDGHVKVLDFGLAKRSESAGVENESSSLTADGAVVGTVSYMSPEQARGQKVDGRTDVFSLGVVLYEMLAGQTPFAGATVSDKLAALLRSEPPPLALPDAAIRKELNRLLAKALAKERDERYQSSNAFAHDLNALTREVQFQAHLANKKAQAATLASSAVRAVTVEKPRKHWLLWAGAAAITLAAVFFGWQWFSKARGAFESEVLPALKHSLVTDFPTGLETNNLTLGIAPNSNLIAYAKGAGNQTDIFVKQINGGEWNVTKDQWFDRTPIWSPDGLQLAYLSQRNGKTEVWLIPFTGGAGRLVKELEQYPRWLVRWSVDGQRIYYEAFRNLYTLDVNSGAVTRLTNLQVEKPNTDYFAVSDDERWLAYCEAVAGKYQIFVVPSAGGAPQQITHEGEANLHPVWLPDGERIAYASQRNGIYQICLAWVSGARKPVQLSSAYEDYIPWDVSPDGQRIFYVSEQQEADLYWCDTATGAERQVTTELALDVFPAFAPDGKKVVYQQISGTSGISQSELLTSALTIGAQPVRTGLTGFNPRWSPAGEQLAFLKKTSMGDGLWLARGDGAEARALVQGRVQQVSYTPFPYAWDQPGNFDWSPDGRRLVYSSTQSGASNIWTIEVDSASAKMISDNTDPQKRLQCPLWSPDGKQLLWLQTGAPAGGGLQQLYLNDGSSARLLFQTGARLRLLGWAASGREFFVSVQTAETPQKTGAQQLWRVTTADGATQELGQLPQTYFNSVTLASGGEQAAYVKRESDRDELWLVALKNGRSRRLAPNYDQHSRISALIWAPQQNGLCYTKQSGTTSLRIIENFK